GTSVPRGWSPWTSRATRMPTIGASERSVWPAGKGRRRHRADRERRLPDFSRGFAGDDFGLYKLRHGKEASAAAVARARRAGEEEDEGARLQDGGPRANLRAVRGVRRGDVDAEGRPGNGRPRHLRLHELRARAQLEGAGPGAHRGGAVRSDGLSGDPAALISGAPCAAPRRAGGSSDGRYRSPPRRGGRGG